ncbi:MAG: sodium/solute symporter [Acidobacteria bacterium]|nr:sodium/solute symporter [Acidobacteriota bacterium]
MEKSHFSYLDYGVLFSYLGLMGLLGSLFYRKRSSTKEFLLGGKSVGWIPVAISVIATDFSAISYISTPAYSYQKNLKLAFFSFSLVLVVPIIVRVFLPFYARLNIYTAYEYLEMRFDYKVRAITSGLFLVLRGGYMAIVIYAPALALSVVTDLPLHISILLMGAFTTVYATLGGMRGVIWTDVVQFTIIVAGIVVIFSATMNGLEGGLAQVWQIAKAHGRADLFDFSFDPRVTDSFWATLFGGCFLVLTTYGADQIIIQRYLSTKSFRDYRRALIMDALLVIPVVTTLYLVGLALFAFYQNNPQLLSGLPSQDAILPFFIVRELPSGISGLLVASIFAAAMSTMSGGINSLTTATLMDFYKPRLRPHETEEHYVWTSRLFCSAWGLLATFGALFVEHFGELANAFNRINSFLGGVILGIFLLGMLTWQANSSGALVGAVVGMLAVSAVGLFTRVSFFWHALIGCAATMIAGYVCSLFTGPPRTHEIRGLVMERVFEIPPRLNSQQ